jgi:pimeloyl-ACP methyl ester carboxylesterase
VRRDGAGLRRDVVVEGKRLETAFWPGPDASRPPLVLLHEGLGSLELWRDLPARLAERTGCGVLAYSRYGYGRSQPFVEKREPDYMHHEARVVLPELLAALRIERPVLFGHSDGASIALRSIAAARDAYPNGLRARLARYHDDVDATFYGWNDIWLDPRFRAWNAEAAADGVRCPVLLIQGDADEYGSLAQLDAIAARVPASQTLLVPGAGHSPHRDAPGAVVERVAAFVAALPR